MVVMLVMAITTSSFLTANDFANKCMTELKIARAGADGFRAFSLAIAGMQGGLGALKKIPEEYLYQSGIAFNPPPIQMGGGTIYYKMSPEDGKININTLVREHDDLPNLRTQEILSRLFEQLSIPPEKIFPLIDWLDKNSEEMGGGAEIFYYSGLKPPRKVKNAPLYSLSELTSVKGFDRDLVYGSLKPKDWNETHSDDFSTDEEKVLITDSDFVLSNNITAFLPYNDQLDERININAAPYYVLISLSEFMTKQAAMKLLKLKLEKGGYIKNVDELEKLPEFQIKTSGGFTLYKELVGENTAVSAGRIKTRGDIYSITGVGIVGNNVMRKVSCLFDLTNNKVLYYSED
ncbi:MAG: general secretion pathway protein GspK [Leptospiraceae bacterium]|nr:general secretion pathway protein GspK [Leptospiraceae bacterium]